MIPLGCWELRHPLRHFPAGFQTAVAAFQIAVFVCVFRQEGFGILALLVLFASKAFVFVVFVLVS